MKKSNMHASPVYAGRMSRPKEYDERFGLGTQRKLASGKEMERVSCTRLDNWIEITADQKTCSVG